MIAEIVKSALNHGENEYGYYLRDKTGHEVDYAVEKDGNLILAEVKASKTVGFDHFKSLEYWRRITQIKEKESFLVYAGGEEKTIGHTRILKWSNTHQIIDK